MDKKNLMPQAAQPINRTTTGQLPPELAELSEEALQLQGEAWSASSSVSGAAISASYHYNCVGQTNCFCSTNGDDAE
jgi:bacteriocin leader peptide (microcyclamide/patellamide family)